MKEALTFDDVLIMPKYSTVSSRKDLDLDTNLGYFQMKLPILSANMDTITGPKMAMAMVNAGGLGVLHRFWTIEENVEAYHYVWDRFFQGVAVSVGLGEYEWKRAVELYNHGARTFVLDVAHGAQQQVADRYKAMKDAYPDITIVVGNFASQDSVADFILGQDDSHGRSLKNGAGFTHIDQFKDYIKVGVGPGSACTTRVKTGVGIPQLSALLDIGQLGVNMIADGGMRSPGDIAKALAAGAKMVMLGGMLAGTDETPGDIIFEPARPWTREMQVLAKAYPQYMLADGGVLKYKQYRGSASKESYEAQGKDKTYITTEGEAFKVSYKGPVEAVLKDIEGGLRSAFSYVGATNLAEFQKNAEFVRVTGAGFTEGTPHGKKG